MTAIVLRGDARCLPLHDESVDLIVTSPPYFALRSYRDGDEHYDGQIGSEPTPQNFLEALWACTAEWWRVLKPGASLWVNLGDKYAGSGGHNNSNLARLHQNYGRPETERHRAADDGHRTVGVSRRNAPDSYNKATIGGARAKSLMGLPWRYANGCVDGMAAPCVCGHPVDRHDRLRLGAWTVTCRECDCATVRRQSWILRAEIVWSKPNGLPESVTDRVRRSHEQWFHLVKEPIYFAGIDEIREPHAAVSVQRAQPHRSPSSRALREGKVTDGTGMPAHSFRLDQMLNSRGKLPGSVFTLDDEVFTLPPEAMAALGDTDSDTCWQVTSEPLRIPLFFVEDDRGWRMFGAPATSAKAKRKVREALWRLAEENFARGVGLRVGEVDHFAAFPTEWPRRIILGWAPNGICTVRQGTRHRRLCLRLHALHRPRRSVRPLDVEA